VNLSVVRRLYTRTVMVSDLDSVTELVAAANAGFPVVWVSVFILEWGIIRGVSELLVMP